MVNKILKDQPSKVNFKPEHFGGYNFFMLLTGVFAGLSFAKSWGFLIGVVASFLIAANFYAKSQNYYAEEEEEFIEIDEGRGNIFN